MSGPLIGILGGYGGVGQATARLIDAWGLGRLRIAGRRPELARQFVDDSLRGEAEAAAADVEDPLSLSRFCSGCRIVINSSGPSYQVLDRVARAAFEAGADYVDPGGDEAIHSRLSGQEWIAAGRTAVLSAGMIPGLSGLLPKWLARQGFASLRSLTAHVCLKDHFTPAAAREYLLSLSSGYGESLAAWRNGRRVSRVAQPLLHKELPFFPRPVSAYPFLSSEAERVAKALGLSDLSWYNVFEGEHVLAAVGRLQAVPPEQRDSAAMQLAQAAELDLFGQAPYQLFVFQMEGEDASGASLTRTLLLRGRDSYELSGTVAALTVQKMLQEAVPPGVHFAMDVLDPAATLEHLRHSPAVSSVEFIHQRAEEEIEMDEGML
jgi:hypothetical protein